MELKFSTGAKYARELIKSGNYRRGVSGDAARSRLNHAFRGLREIYDLIRAADTHDLPQELEWLADNRYILQRERNLSRRRWTPCPAARRGAFCAGAGAGATGARFRRRRGRDAGERHALLSDAQREASLTEAELYAMPVMLRLAAILFLAEPQEELLASARNIGKARRSGNHALSRRLGYAFGMLRFLASMQLESSLQEISVLERIFVRDPARTRTWTRRQRRLPRRNGAPCKTRGAFENAPPSGF